MTLKLADFGLALNLREERAVTRVGTLDYMAPEVLRCPLKRHPADNKERADLHYTGTVDAWAVGVLAYELLTGRCVRVCLRRCCVVAASATQAAPNTHKCVRIMRACPCAHETMAHRRAPFSAAGASDASIEAAIHGAQPVFPSRMSDAAKAFIAAALAKAPSARPSIVHMLQHSWIRSFKVRGGEMLDARRHVPFPPLHGWMLTLLVLCVCCHDLPHTQRCSSNGAADSATHCDVRDAALHAAHAPEACDAHAAAGHSTVQQAPQQPPLLPPPLPPPQQQPRVGGVSLPPVSAVRTGGAKGAWAHAGGTTQQPSLSAWHPTL